MKKIITTIIIASAAAAVLWGLNATRHGAHEIINEIAVFNATDESTQILLLDGDLFRDSSGSWVQIDNSEDSCTQPIQLVDSTRQLVCGDWISVSMTIKSVSAQLNSAHIWRVHSRFYSDLKMTVLEDWVVKSNTTSGDGVHTVKDSILTIDSESTEWERQHHMIWVQGHQIRMCPDEIFTTGSDSIFVDSVTVRCR